MIPDYNPDSEARLLVVNLNETDAHLLRRAAEAPWAITRVQTGEQALAALANEACDLALVAAALPDMTGFTLLKTLRGQPGPSPAIILAGLSHSREISRALSLGADDFLTLPFDPPVAAARIAMQLKQRRLAATYRQAIDEQQAIHKMRDRFFNMASHDLKNPMNNIRMAQHLLRAYVVDSDKARALLDNIDLALQMMDDIVRDFLETAALQSQGLDLDLTGVVAEDALWRVITQHHFTAHKKNISLRLLDADGVVLADPNRLLQILGNLVSNAIKYSPPNSSVTLAAVPDDRFVRFQVHDSGPGIPEDERDRLFSEFGKLSTRPTAGENSTGLGLWIVKQLTLLMDGRVGVECPPEGGSIFWAELPVWESSRASAQADKLVTSA
jgi:two-component system sensor histidine kinase/response regulator